MKKYCIKFCACFVFVLEYMFFAVRSKRLLSSVLCTAYYIKIRERRLKQINVRNAEPKT